MCEFIRKSLTADVFWVMATALFTFILCLVAWRQLRDLARTSRIDLLYRLRSDFYTTRNRRLTFWLDYERLKFIPGDGPSGVAYFYVIQDGVLTDTPKAIATQWVDDYLGLLEDIAGFWKSRLLTISEVYDSFGYYVILVAEDQAIRDYISWARQREGKVGDDIYKGLLDLYTAAKKHEGKK